MFAHITFIATFILGGFGLKALLTEMKGNDYKKILYVFGGGALVPGNHFNYKRFQ